MESNTNVTVNENAGEVSFMLEVIADTLLYTVGVEVRTTAISASGKPCIFILVGAANVSTTNYSVNYELTIPSCLFKGMF